MLIAMPQPVTDVGMRAVGGEAGLADRGAKMGQADQAACRTREYQHDAQLVLGKGSLSGGQMRPPGSSAHIRLERRETF